MVAPIFLRLRRAWARVSLGSIALALCGACGTETEQREPASTTAPTTRSVCSECPVQTGGESSDFGGTPHPCVLFEQHVAITGAQAAELGFDMMTVVRLIEREIDAPLRWTAPTMASGAPPAGYEQETRIEGRARLGDGITHVRLDPQRCAGVTCFDDRVGELICSDRLELGVELELRTLDGAVSAAATGYVLQGREGFPFESPAGSLRANLRDVNGSLEIYPPERPPVVLALLMIDLFFEREQTEGDLRPYLQLSASPGTAQDYVPLAGHWPDVPLPAVAPSEASPDVEAR